MPQIYLNFSGELGPSDNQKLLHTLKDVGKEDELVISIDANDAHQADQIFGILNKHDFQVLPKGSESGLTYSILAKRK